MASSHPDQPTDDFSAAIYTTVAHSRELHKHLSEQLDPEGVEWLSDWHSEPKWAVGYTFIRAGLHHVRGWTMLAHERLYVPCLALFRPMIEADIRGLWLCLQATDKELAEWRKNRTKFQFPSFRKMTSSVASHAKLPEGLLSAGQWEELCDFTHAGFGLIEHSLRMEANSQAFAVEIVEAIRRATTAGGISAYLFAERQLRRFFRPCSE